MEQQGSPGGSLWRTFLVLGGVVAASQGAVALAALTQGTAGTLAAVGAGVAACGAGIWWAHRRIVATLGCEPRELRAVAERLAQGELDTRPPLPGRDDGGSVAASLAALSTGLHEVVHRVRGSIDRIGGSSQEIAQGNADLSSRTEAQADRLQQTSAALEQMTATIRQNTDAAKQASQLASSASEVAERGGTVVGDVVARMGEIQASSRKIAEIIGVIDGIAFQTNILALNAAVEAARAGEQGRGFAVVAGEVRNLAQRSAQAAREIKSLISDSVEKVESGSKLVHDAGQTMSDIVNQVKRVTDLIGEITSATMEQNTGIAQLNEAVTQLDDMTAQNALLVEMSAAAAMSLREQAGELAEAVAVFRIGSVEAGVAIRQAQATSATAAMAPSVPAPTRPSASVPPATAAAATPPAATPASAPAAAPPRARPAAPTPARVEPAAARPGDDWEEF